MMKYKPVFYKVIVMISFLIAFAANMFVSANVLYGIPLLIIFILLATQLVYMIMGLYEDLKDNMNMERFEHMNTIFMFLGLVTTILGLLLIG